jgi:anti-sigma-K factor RskA
MSAHSNIPEDVAALITAHALGALDADQAELAERHIAESDDCRRAYEDALETAAALALAVADSEPPADLRARIVAAARAERPEAAPAVRQAAPRRRLRLVGWLTPSTGFAVLGVAAAIVFALIAVSQHDSASSARDREQALAGLIAAPGARVVPMLPSGGGAAGGRVVLAQGRAALVSSMARLPSGRTYQAWGLPSGGGAPVPLPTFSRPGDVVIVPDAGKYAQLLVTVEPSGGSKTPSAAPIAAAKL